MMKLLGRNCPKRLFRRKPSFCRCFWLVAVFIHTNWKHQQQKHIRAEARRWIALPKTNSSPLKTMVGRWKFLLGWHVFGGHIDIDYRIILSLNVLWILPMAQRWRWKAWLAGSGTWQYGIDEEKWMKIKYKIMNTYQVLQTRTNLGQQGKTFPKSTARDLQYLPSCETYWVDLILTYFNLYHDLMEFEKPFPSFSFEKLLLQNQWFFFTPFSGHFWVT